MSAESGIVRNHRHRTPSRRGRHVLPPLLPSRPLSDERRTVVHVLAAAEVGSGLGN